MLGLVVMTRRKFNRVLSDISQGSIKIGIKYGQSGIIGKPLVSSRVDRELAEIFKEKGVQS
jgi:hypothetical protein